MIKSLKELYFILDPLTKLHFAVLMIPMAVTIAVEVFSIGLILPLIQILLIGEEEGPFTQIIVSLLPMKLDEGLEIYVMLLFALVFCLKNLLFLGMVLIINLVVGNKTAIFGQRLFNVYVSLPLEYHFNNNSASMIVNIRTSVGLTMDSVRLILMTILDFMMTIGIFALLVFHQAEASFIALLAFGAIGLFYYKYFSPILQRWGRLNLELEQTLVKWIAQTFDNIRNVKIMRYRSYLGDKILEIGKSKYLFDTLSKTSIQIPRLILEISMVLGCLIIVVYLKSEGNTSNDIIYTLGLFGMAALRLMPSLSRILTTAAELRRNSAHITKVFDSFAAVPEGEYPRSEKNPIIPLAFSQSFELKNISYTYPGATRPSLNNINLSIKKGERIGFVGMSGAGKSTLLDVILGLLRPSVGQVLADGTNILENLESWQATIGFVPQDVFLLDDTIINNVAFGIPVEEINLDQVNSCLRLAKLDNFIDTLPLGENTVIGENGARISGGQKQRLAIARALYSSPQVLIFDEATSELDNLTEQEITLSLGSVSKDKTVLIVAHRLTTVRQCDRIVFFIDGVVRAIGTFSELMDSCIEFNELASVDGK